MSGLVTPVSSSLSLLDPSQCLCPALSTEVSLSPSGEGNFSHHRPLPATRPGGQYRPWLKVNIRGSILTLFKGVRPRMGLPETYSGIWGILVHLSPPVQVYLWTTSFLGRIPPVCTRGWSGLSSSGVVRPKLLTTGVLGSENSTGCILIRNHLTLRTHTLM